MTDAIDSKAREMAAEVRGKLDGHLKHHLEADRAAQAERAAMRGEIAALRTEVVGSIARVHDRLDTLQRTLAGRWLTVAGGIILSMAAVIGYLIAEGQPWL